MRAVQACHSAFLGSQPRLLAPFLLSQGLGRSTSLTSPQFTPAPWPSHRLCHYYHVRPGSAVRFKQPRHASSGWGVALVACIIGGAAALQLFYRSPEKSALPQENLRQQRIQEHNHNYDGIIDTLKMSSQDIPPGHLGNLTKEQEAKLREMWTILFKLFGIKFEGSHLEKSPTSGSNPPQSPTDNKKKSRRSFFGLGSRKEEPTSAESGIAGLSLSDEDDKYGQTNEFRQAVADLTPEQLRESLWSMTKADHPDSLLLRFLRARKWDVNRAIVMLISTIRWRLVEMHVDDDIMGGGEAKALEMSNSSDQTTKKLGADFMDQTRMGKSIIHGVDKQGRPICMIRVKMHRIGVHAEKSTERYTVHMIETARLMLPRPVETAVVMFDMTGFSMANMDYTPVKFIIKCFEANYPESLGVVLIHQAPWIFSGIWKIIKGWLDPVVAAKVHFTNTTEDLEVFIDRKRLLKQYGGEDDSQFEYIEVQPGENDQMKDNAKREEVIAKHKAIAQELQDATKSWIEAANKGDDEAVESWKAKREELASKYSQQYWETDPYIRARSLYDRNGVILGGGKVSFYNDKGTEEDHKNTKASDSAETITTGIEEEKKAETNGIASTTEVNGVDTATPAVAVSAN